jgi:hypothetical protein
LFIDLLVGFLVVVVHARDQQTNTLQGVLWSEGEKGHGLQLLSQAHLSLPQREGTAATPLLILNAVMQGRPAATRVVTTGIVDVMP